MSKHLHSETAKTLARLSAGVVNSETLMDGASSGPRTGLPDEVTGVSQVGHKVGLNGNADTGATATPVVAVETRRVGSGETRMVGNEFYGDGISLLVEVHRSLEKDDDGKRERGCQGKEVQQGDKRLFEGMNGEGNEAEGMENERDSAIDEGPEEDSAREDVGNSKHAHAVGDLVWGKIKSHPWWPGRIYDASSASEFAVKYSHSSRLLVAYFGDGSFSWCLPSQLVPFVDNFERMSKQSTSKSFLYAVEMALDEINVLVELYMTCRCISEDSRAGLSWPFAVNAGIKEGIPVPEGKAIRDLLSQYEPAEILFNIKHHAKSNSIFNTLEFTVLKSWLSAFFLAKCGRPLPLYSEPLRVEGLEDKKRDQVNDMNDFSIPIEVPIQGPSEEEWLSSPKAGPGKCPVSVGDKLYHRRKQKSVAELMGDGIKPKGKKTTSEDSTPSTVETSKKKRRKSAEQDGGETGSIRSVDEKVGKRISKKSGNADLAKTKGLSVSIPERDDLGDLQNMGASPSSRERKKSKYLSPPYMSFRWTAEKSSPKRDLEIESQKISDTTRIGERVTRAARLILSPPEAKNGIEAVKKKVAEKFDGVDKSPRMGKQRSMTSDTTGISASVNEVLSGVQSTAVNPFFLRDASLEKISAFIYLFRDSVYLNRSNYKLYHKGKTGKKRKSLDSGKVIAQNDTKSPESVPSHAKKRKTNHIEAEDVTKRKKAAIPSSQGTEGEEAGKETSSAILMVTFSIGVSLPSKDEIVRMFSKFGNLNEKETKVLHDSNCAQIVYGCGSDAEEAFKESIKHSPFGAAKVNYRLSYPSRTSKTPESGKRTSSLKKNPELPLSSLKADKGKSQVPLIKQKLKAMASILDKCKGRITMEEKSNIEGEIKGLLEKVRSVASTNP